MIKELYAREPSILYDFMTQLINSSDFSVVICASMYCDVMFIATVASHSLKILITKLVTSPSSHLKKYVPLKCTDCLVDGELFLEHLYFNKF